jgi:hypothetical protein
MIKRVFWIAVGAVGALQLDRWLTAKRSRFTPSAITGALLDKVNDRLEAGRANPPG